MCLKHDEFYPGQYYHMYNHAVSGQMLFRDRTDFENAEKLMTRYYSSNDFELVAYCLMPNHFHMLISQKTDLPAYTFIYKWSRAYSRYFNTRHRTIGTIFSDKLQSVSVKDESKLLRLCAFIHSNPVKAQMISNITDWEWSNYSEWTKQNQETLSENYHNRYNLNTKQKYQDFVKDFTTDFMDKEYLIDT